MVHPLEHCADTRGVWRQVGVSWLLAAIVACPQLFIFVQTDERDGSSPEATHDGVIHKCESKGYTAEWQRKAYMTFLASYMLVVPICIMSFCYISIIRVLCLTAGERAREIDEPLFHFVTSRRSQAASDPAPATAVAGNQQFPELPRGHSTPALHNATGMPRRNTTKRKVIKMSLSVMVAFVVCWAPYFVISLIRIYSEYQYKLTIFLMVSELVTLSHSMINPLIYIIFSYHALHVAFTRLCQRANLCCCRGPRQANLDAIELRELA